MIFGIELSFLKIVVLFFLVLIVLILVGFFGGFILGFFGVVGVGGWILGVKGLVVGVVGGVYIFGLGVEDWVWGRKICCDNL